ncbi:MULTISPECIES: HIT domain-containing protein [unclassified Frigoribacterium]|uniref:HIT family protein n=1 Tax=unclassified Frigoribacterium TaxID=2627005 RepID=UPI000FB1EAA5|nr:MULTISPECIES: HIT domain-containing protein [unclassified Frigoribacterium]ROP77779.1 ATP adenylyltransferase [Frigoribacterium sp. PhB107]TDT65622.1 ATP adenylyltransferase [Frigoribacterium sp. PhB116]
MGAGADELPADVDPADHGSARVESSDDFASAPDAFQRLWTPHRAVYVSRGQGAHDDACPFCAAPSRSDDDALIVARGQHAFVLLNLYPYNPGHLLVCPYRHISTYDLATPDEVAEIGALTQTAMRVVREVSHAQGFNMGMNQGSVGGAGIAEHLHQHVVPRYGGDSNFFPIIAQTKAVTQLLGDVREALAAAWPAGGDQATR